MVSLHCILDRDDVGGRRDNGLCRASSPRATASKLHRGWVMDHGRNSSYVARDLEWKIVSRQVIWPVWHLRREKAKIASMMAPLSGMSSA